jgi:hypothetical protein
MAAPAPNAFSGHLEKWILEKSKQSIFFINIMHDTECTEELKELVETVDHVPEDERDALFNGEGHTATGFVVQEGPHYFKILTCAHVIGHVFSADHPLSRDDANRMFITQVICDHYEMSFRRPGQDIHPNRVYAQGHIIGLSCRDDLMLIQVPRADVMNLDEICLRNHPHLPFSQTRPVAFDDCVMVSWPPLRHRTAVKGCVSHTSRSFNDLGEDNPVGYRINLLEVKIASEEGSSGAPLLNGNGKVIGMLHGGFGGPFSYFVRIADIIPFLVQRGVVLRKFSRSF